MAGFIQRFSYTATMSTVYQARRLDLKAFAQDGQPLTQTTLVHDLDRLAQEAEASSKDAAVVWTARAEFRPGSGAEEAIWLHLQASTTISLVCQRCIGTVATPLRVDRWYRFVETEVIAMEQDDASEEDLLVLEPQFDLVSVVEDELLMALPLVPMHDHCQVALVLQVGEQELLASTDSRVDSKAKPHPFAALQALKKNAD